MNSEEYPDGFCAQELHFGVDLSFRLCREAHTKSIIKISCSGSLCSLILSVGLLLG